MCQKIENLHAPSIRKGSVVWDRMGYNRLGFIQRPFATTNQPATIRSFDDIDGYVSQ